MPESVKSGLSRYHHGIFSATTQSSGRTGVFNLVQPDMMSGRAVTDFARGGLAASCYIACLHGSVDMARPGPFGRRKSACGRAIRAS